MDKKQYTFYIDEEKTKAFTLTYDELIIASKNLFFMVLKSLNIDNELRAEHRADDETQLTLYAKYLNKHKGIDEATINTKLFEFIESLYIETLRILDIDNKLTDEEKYVPKKYDDSKMSLTEKLLEKDLIEPNLWNKFDDYLQLAIENYDFNISNYDLQWYNYQQEFIDYFITHVMFYWGEGLGLPSELNPILTNKRNIKQIKLKNFENMILDSGNRLTDSENRIYKLYINETRTDAVFITYDELIKTTKNVFFKLLKSLNIDNELRAEHRADDESKLTLYAKYLNKHKGIDEATINTKLFEFIESLYIETLRILDIDNKLTDEEKYVPKKYDDSKMSLTEKLEIKDLIEPNLWNKFDDYWKLAIENYDFINFDHDFHLAHYQKKFYYFFITEIMFYWGNEIALPKELNPIAPYLIDMRMK